MQPHGLYLFIFFLFHKGHFLCLTGNRMLCVCVCACVFVILRKTPTRNGETDLFSTNSRLSVRWREKRREVEEQFSCWTAETAFRFLRFYFCTLYIWILSVAVQKYPPRIPKVLLYKDTKSLTLIQRSVITKRAVTHVFLSLLPSLDWSFMQHGQSLWPLFNQICIGNHKTCGHHLTDLHVWWSQLSWHACT